jgi:uncharacterized protein YlxW (UPF0749 family)
MSVERPDGTPAPAAEPTAAAPTAPASAGHRAVAAPIPSDPAAEPTAAAPTAPASAGHRAVAAPTPSEPAADPQAQPEPAAPEPDRAGEMPGAPAPDRVVHAAPDAHAGSDAVAEAHADVDAGTATAPHRAAEAGAGTAAPEPGPAAPATAPAGSEAVAAAGSGAAAPAPDRAVHADVHAASDAAAGSGAAAPAPDRAAATAAAAPAHRTQTPSRRRRAGVWIGLLAALLGFALAVQVKSTESMALPTARQEDLVRILDDLNAREERLRRDIADLERTRRELTSGAVGSEAALEEARRRAQQLALLAGTIPATGPGVVITLTEGTERLPADLILDAMEELRGAGAESLQITGREGGAVRVGTATYFLDSGGGILVDGKSLRGPYTIVAIGDKATLAAALNIPGGVVNTVEQASAAARIEQRDKVVVTALRRAGTPQYAHPAS